MNDPVRLRDDPAALPACRALLDQRFEPPVFDNATRALAASFAADLVAPAAASVAAGSSAAAATPSVSTAVSKVAAFVGSHMLATTLAVTAVVSGAVIIPHQLKTGVARVSRARIHKSTASASPAVSASAIAVLPSIPAAGAAAPSRRELVLESPGKSAESRSSPAPIHARREDANTRVAGNNAVLEPQAVGSSSLLREAEYLERARQGLQRHPRRALGLALRHRTEFPNAVLTAESEAIAVEALVRLGRTSEARSRVEQVLRNDPRSIYAERLRHLVGGN